jgi:sugar-specific transcriptional regulator TrmB
MMEISAYDALESLGLTDKEIKVYITLLELGEGAVNSITKKSEINRVTVYPIIQKLIEKGFVSKLFKEGKSYFKAIPPKQILDILKEKSDKIKLVLPELEKRTNISKTSTSIELFRGRKGMYSFIERLYSGEEKQLYAYGNFDVAKKAVEYQAMHGRKLRILKKIKLDITISPFYEDYLKEKDYKKVTRIRFNKSLMGLNVYIIFGKRMICIFEVSKELVGILIENEELAKYHKFVFDKLWKEGYNSS